MKKVLCLSMLALCASNAWAADAISLDKVRELETTLVGKKDVSVTPENYAFAELDVAMNEEVKHGATNKFYHHRMPMEIDKQPAVLMNRDTLYSFAIIDASHGATVHVPEGDGRYISLHVMDHDHTTEHVYYGAGDYKIDPDKATHFLVLNIRTQVNPNDPADIQKAHVIQDEYKVTFPDGYTPKAFKMIDWNTDELKKLQAHYRQLADKRGVSKTSGPRGDYPQEDVNIGAAVATGLLPDKDAWYSFNTYKVDKNTCYTATYQVPGMAKPDLGFYSLTIYGDDLYLHNEKGSSLSNKELKLDSGGKTFTMHYGTEQTCGKDAQNLLISPTDNWTLALRVYFPTPDIQDNKYKLPEPKPVK
ncbi:DUF1254 domain-containing protein [Buttiauxella gaviniae]|uniref:DUF1254 domain-containing protein n=1 Tax=Buttiauxella gaviniae TaxID=82990 RepID=UPI003C70A23C